MNTKRSLVRYSYSEVSGGQFRVLDQKDLVTTSLYIAFFHWLKLFWTTMTPPPQLKSQTRVSIPLTTLVILAEPMSTGDWCHPMLHCPGQLCWSGKLLNVCLHQKRLCRTKHSCSKHCLINSMFGSWVWHPRLSLQLLLCNRFQLTQYNTAMLIAWSIKKIYSLKLYDSYLPL